MPIIESFMDTLDGKATVAETRMIANGIPVQAGTIFMPKSPEMRIVPDIAAFICSELTMRFTIWARWADSGSATLRLNKDELITTEKQMSEMQKVPIARSIIR